MIKKRRKRYRRFFFDNEFEVNFIDVQDNINKADSDSLFEKASVYNDLSYKHNELEED